MHIGFIGYGSMTRALAPRFHTRHDIVIGGRSPARARELAAEIGDAVDAGNSLRAAQIAEVVILAVPAEEVFNVIDEVGPATFAGKVVVDITNPVQPNRDDFLPNQFDGVSMAESIQRRLRQASVVKAFNMAHADVWAMQPPTFDGQPLRVMYCADNDDAKAPVAELVETVGATPVDMGELRYARSLEAAAGLVIKLLFSGAPTQTTLNLTA
jgi:hypothetical protein